MKSRYFFFLLLILVLIIPLYSEDTWEIQKIDIAPVINFPGDLSRMRIHLKIKEGVLFQLPKTLPKQDWIHISNIRIFENGEEKTIYLEFIAFMPGTRNLPKLRFGDVVLDDIKINILSLTEKEGISEFGPLFGQVFLPFTRISFIFLILIIVFVFLFSLKIYHGLRNHIIEIISAQKKRQVNRNIHACLKKLKAEIQTIPSRDFYSYLSGELRQYLSFLLQKNLVYLTTREIVKLFKQTSYENDFSAILDFLIFSDTIKFGHRDAVLARRKADIDIVEEFLDKIQKGEITLDHL